MTTPTTSPMSAPTFARTTWILALALGLAACSDGLPPEWKITDYRIMAVVAEPPEVDPDGTVELVVADYDPERRPVTYEWSVCLLSFGSATNYACVDESLDYPIEGGGPTASIDFGPDGLNLRALYEAFGPVPNAAGEAQTLEDGFDVYVHVISRSAGGREESTYKRVRIREGDDLNTNPITEGFTVDDAPPGPIRVGQDVEIKLVLADVEREVDPDGNEESYLYQWLGVDGDIPDVFGIPSNKIDYTAPDAPGIYPIFVVVRDRRGGTTFERLDLTVIP